MEPHRRQPAAALLREAVHLGPARVVLRARSGFTELFCDTACLELSGGWLNLRRPEAHLHVQLDTLTGARLLEAGGDGHPHVPSLWLLGRCGEPCLIVILDRVPEADRAHQRRVFAVLRARWGERVEFAPGGAAERVLH